MQTLEGQCLCGACRYTATAAEMPEEFGMNGLGACHCQMCRRFSGGVFLSRSIAPGSLRFADDGALGVYQSSDWAERGFCKTCGSSLYWKLTAPGPHSGMIALAAGTLDDLGDAPLDHEVFIDRKPAGYSFAQATKQMTEAEVMAMAGGEG
ncbi:MAG: GFA family protein [Pseudomonadota bacterium]